MPLNKDELKAKLLKAYEGQLDDKLAELNDELSLTDTIPSPKYMDAEIKTILALCEPL
jgi:hypothetical protein